MNDLETCIQITYAAACYVEVARSIRRLHGALKGCITGYPHIVQSRIIETNLVTGLDGYIEGRIRIRIGHNQCQGDIDSRIVYIHIPTYERQIPVFRHGQFPVDRSFVVVTIKSQPVGPYSKTVIGKRRTFPYRLTLNIIITFVSLSFLIHRAVAF